MNAVPDRMLALAQRFSGMSVEARQALQGKMREQGLTLEALPIPPRAAGIDLLPASYAQQRLWFIWQLEPQATAYNLTGAFRLRGRLDRAALEQTLAALLARHEVLRTTFVLAGDSVQQVIHAHMACPLAQVAADEAGLHDAIALAAQTPFDLEHGPLMRARLIRLGEQDHVLVLTLHHIVTDGASLPILIEEFTRHYAAFASGQAPQLEALPIQYADFSQWQRLWLEAGEGERQLQYWREQLGDEHPLLTLPLDHKRPPVSSQRGDSVALQVPAAVLEGLRGVARAQGCTLFVVLLASLHALLHRYSGERDIRVGVPIANRTRNDVQDLLGFFINTQVLRSQPEPQQAFSSLVEALKRASIGAQAHQDVPFEQLVDALQPERSLNQSPLFQVMLNHQHGAVDNVGRWQLQGLEVEVLGWEERSSKFDLMLDTVETADSLSAAFTYATDLFEADTIERMGRHWLNLLHSVVRDPHTALGDLALLDADEQAATLAQWNPAPQHYTPGQCLHQRIEQQAALRPEATAVVCEGQRLSYGELNRQANQLAWRLREQGVGPDVLVGIALPRSAQMLVGLLAILKAGGAYVPLDPEYPQERLAYLIEDSGTRLVISQADLLARLPLPEGVQTLLLDEAAAWLAAAPQHDLPNLTHVDNLAYVIYTSGSTGKPKGTLLPHANVLRLFDATQQWFAFDQHDVWSLFHSYAFDFSVWEIFGALLYGGTLVVVPYAVSRSPQDFHRLLREEGVTVLNQTPSAFRPLIDVALAARDEGPLALRTVVFGGEALEVNDLRPWFEAFGDRQPQLVNMYGITETTVHVSYRPLSLADLDASNSSPLGLPIDDLSWYVLDGRLNPVAKGCVGELYVGGAGLARGYHQRPDLTTTRFIADPFARTPGARLYRTGDLARFSADGSLEYIGRIDHQVKIRGFRIELGEIQRCLQNHPQVAQALVLVHEANGSKQLVGYLVAKAGVEAGSSTFRQGLRDFLRAQLPDYMVPAHLLVLDAWPLTGNGKLDRKALPVPGAELSATTWQAPQNALQADLVALWEEVLKRAPIGIDDNFFELGGDSIISIQLVSRARQRGIRFSPKDLFQYQTVQSLARVAERSAAVQVSQGPVHGAAPLTPIQHWFFEQPIAKRAHWNQSLLLTVRHRLEAQPLREALAAVVRQHDALRLRFTQQDGLWQQHHADDATEQALVQVAQAADADELLMLCNQAQASLDLSQGPLLRALLVDMADGSQRLLLVVHHLVVDGVSWRVLLEDLQQASQQQALPNKTSAYQHWAQRLQQYAQSPTLLAEAAYWHEQYRDVAPGLPCQAVDTPAAEQILAVETALDADTTRQLLQQAPAAYRTQINDLLLTALAQVICAWTGQASTLVQLEGHGREELFDDIDLSRTVGWFTSIFPLKLTPAAEPGASLKGIKEQLRAVPHKGIGFAILRYLADQGLAALPAPAITFNYMGQFDASFDTQAPWQPAQESGGNEQAPGSTVLEGLSINGQVYEGQLRLSWSFDPRRFDGAQVQSLADAYGQALRTLVAHCLTCEGGLTPSDVPLANLDQRQLDNLALPATVIEDIYPLSPMQQGMLFHSLYDDEPGAYVHQLRLDVEGLQVDALRQAWQAALDAHDTLRAGFLWGDSHKQPLQLIRRQVELPLLQADFQGQPRSALDAFAEADRQRGFDLAAAPLLRVNVLQTDADRYHLIVTHHHILLDGWSTSQLLGEVMQRYAGIAPPPASGRYHDYMAWLAVQDPQAAEAFWKAQLGELQEPTLLANCTQGDASTRGFGEYFQVLDHAASERLGQFARQHKVTLNSLVQAAWLLLLQRYSGQDCVAFGATVAGRPVDLPGIEQQLGLFINTLPVIASPHPHHSVAQWVQAIQAQNVSLREFEHTPLAEVQRLAGQGNLFDTLLVFENYPLAEALQQGPETGLRILDVEGREQTHFPLTLSADFGARLSLRYNYAHAAFSDGFIARLHQHLCNLLLAMAEAPLQALGRLDVLSASEREQQVLQWNDTAVAYPAVQPVQRLFELQAERTPDAPALVFGDQQLSYAELNRRANRLAHRLRDQGVGPEVLVGIAAERSLELVIGLLAILKAGGAYVPLDPDYPDERLAYMIEDSGIDLLLTQRPLRERLPLAVGVQVLCLDAPDLESGNHSNLPLVLDAAGLAYMIYTSGSTGRPKGAANRHDALYNRLMWMQSAYPIGAGDTVLQKTPFSFDVSVWEFFWPLMVGARLAIAEPGAHRDPAALVALINRHQVSTLHFVPSMLQAFVRDDAVVSCTSLRQVICSGEALPAELQRHLLRVLPWAGLYNLYGPTEAAIDVTHWTCRDDGSHSVPIGQPIANLHTYVLDSSLQLQAAGCVGELYLGGVGLARGYHRRPGLTAERFVASPFVAGERLYRTGDLARYRADGVIEYVGRIDHQVKIRGLRIELGEIEAALLEQPGVAEAVVLALDIAKSKQLVAYLVPEADGFTVEVIKTALAERLPEHMQPAQLIELAAMPVTANGKLDRRRLPAPQVRSSQGSAPRTALEASLLAIWQALFERQDIGIDDDFFELGGDSIVSIQAVGLARKMGLAITPKQVFSHPTIAALAQVTGSADAEQVDAPALASVALGAAQLQALGLHAEQVEDAYPLSPMQQGMLFHSLQDGDDGLYVNQIEVGVVGADPQRMQAAWEAVARQHAILRTAFLWEGEKEPLQVVLRDAPTLLTLLDWRDHDNVAQAVRELADSEREKGFSLGRAPLLRVLLVRTEADRYRLIWTYHHILMDGWSVSRLIGDVLRHYSGEALLPVAEYRHYIGWLQQQDPARSEAFWKARLSELEGPTHLARAVPVKAPAEGYRALYTQLDAEQTARLTQFAQSQRVTLNTLVQAAWLLLLQRYTGQRTVTFGATVSGRPETLDGSEQMLGLFINTLPVVSSVPTAQSVGDWLREVQAYNLQIRDHQHTPLSDIQRWAGQGGQALFDSIIVFENQPVDRTLREWDGESLRFEDVSDYGLTSFAMDLMVSVDDGGLRIEYMHQCEQFDLVTVEQMRGHMESLMQRLCDDPAQAVGCLGLLEGRPQQLQACPAPQVNTPVHTLIARRAQAKPDHPALVLGDEVLDYATLERRANALAVQLCAQGVGAETVVGVFMERSLELVVSLLAVLKSGGAYVPLDPEYPAERLRYMMADAGMSVLLTQQRLQARVSVEASVACLAVDQLALDVDVDTSVLPAVDAQGLAYLIYTSGSTGKPKSVAVAHGPISMHVQAIAELYEMDSNERELHFMSFAFDGAHERWMTALISGSTLVIRDNSLWTAEQTLNVLTQQRITVACFPPAYLLELAEQAETLGAAPPVRVYCFGGDAVPDATFERVKRSLAPKYLVNGYGPTETVVTPLLWKTPLSGSCEAMYAPIGKAVGVRTLYVLDADLNPLPPGFVGELYIGAEGVARGYHHHRQQTAERFVADPYGEPGSRLYRTGDLVRMRSDGVVDYVGRVDHQVKVRGFRIELGEIEARLREQAGIKDALVVVRDSAQGRQLIGYVVAAAEAGLDRRLLQALRESLPDYMVPTQVVVMAQFPLTPNGKLDRKALPDPDFGSREHVAPRTPLQAALVQIWQQVLGIEQVGITDNFFELGGDSLRTLKVISRVRAMPELGFEVKLRDMMAKPTIAGLTADQPEAAEVPQALLLLNQPVADSAPLFCLHAGFGTVFDYEPLARHLEGQRTVYGVQCRMLLDRHWQDTSLEQMAIDYSAEIRAKQAEGPYHLAGWSLGGTLALLVARELEAQGQAVRWLGLVDSYVPLDTVPDGEDWRADLQAFLCATLGMDAAVVQPVLDAQECIEPQQVAGLIAGVIQRQPDQAGGYALLGAEELAHTFIVSERLKQLSREVPVLPVVRAPLRCWWASGNPTGERAALEAQQPRIIRTQLVQASHYDILHHADCLQGLLSSLEAEAVTEG
ncbi:non-ribosomal peptide synthetase [Pseudomonas sp. H9]|uniref:non-ribosomal peptide synthetase n=1 Tax=Pseudomonas sp. H9 TaxID=483968 RepID=UPI0010579215|nr:non-ribosomal peptide synthetase [Pseudomonas sp. H9]TDF82583.1 amino acid adenylation domain-containing protein [Pseudomonas sp. H9]